MKIPHDAFKFMYVHLVTIKYAYKAKNLKGLPVRQWLWSGPQMSSQLFIWHFWYKTEKYVNSFSPSDNDMSGWWQMNSVLFFQNTSSLLEARESIRPLMEPTVMLGLWLSSVRCLSKCRKLSLGGTAAISLQPRRKRRKRSFSLEQSWTLLTEMRTERQVHSPVTSSAFSPTMMQEGL